MTKRWVFEELVKNDKDSVGLIAYALYKHRKHLLAKRLRDQNHPEAHIQEQVQIFHDQTLQNDSLDDFKEKANIYLSEIVAEVEAKAEKRIEKLASDHAKELKKEKERLLKSIQRFPGTERAVWERLLIWLLSGVPALAAGFFVSLLFWGTVMLFVPADGRQDVLYGLVPDAFKMQAPKKSIEELPSTGTTKAK